MARAHRYYIPGNIYHLTHQALPSASPRQAAASKEIFS